MRNEQNELQAFLQLVTDTTKTSTTTIDFLNQLFITWFGPVSDLPAKFHQDPTVKKRKWTSDEINLFRAYIGDENTLSLQLSSYAIQDSPSQATFAAHCKLYGVVFFKGLACLPETTQRQLFNDLLMELIRVRQYNFLEQLIFHYSNLVNFRILLHALENSYQSYSENVLSELQLDRIKSLLHILPEIHVCFAIPESVDDHSMREMRFEIKPVILVKTEDNHTDVQERFVKIMRQIIAIRDPRIDSFFPQSYDFIFKQFSLYDCITWLKASDFEKNEKKCAVTENLFVIEFTKKQKTNAPVFFQKLINHGFSYVKSDSETPVAFLLRIFDRANTDKKIQKVLLSLKWLCNGFITYAAPISQHALTIYRENKPEAKMLREKIYNEKIKKLNAFIDEERGLLSVFENNPALKAQQGEGSLFRHTQQSLEKYRQKKEAIENELSALKKSGDVATARL